MLGNNVHNDGSSNPSTTSTPEGEGVSKLHDSGCVVLALDGHLNFMKPNAYSNQAKISKAFEGFILQNFTAHFGKNVFMLFGEAYEPLMQGAFVLLVTWAMLGWMHRRKVFLRS